MKMLVLDKDDNWMKTLDKLDEECKEVKEIVMQLVYAESFDIDKKVIDDIKNEIAGELLDVIQVCIGGLDKLGREGKDVENYVLKHNEKLINRGWNISYILQILKGRWFE